MAFELFGLEIKKKRDRLEDIPQLDVEPNGSYVTTQASASQYDFDFISSTEVDLINSYRRISYMPEVASAIDKIINEIAIQDDQVDVVAVQTSKLVDNKIFDKKIIEKIEYEANNVFKLLDFNSTAHTKIRDWYVDSRIIFQKIIDPNRPSDGVLKLVQLDPRKIKRVEIVEETRDGLLKIIETFYVYMTNVQNGDIANYSTQHVQMTYSGYEMFRKNVSFKIRKDAIAYIDSGLVDRTSGISYGHMHKAVKIANQLDLVETAVIIYRLSRSSERRAIYVDAGNLPPTKSRELLEATKADFRNKVYYDSVRGTIEDKARVMAMQEDYFMLRRGGKNGTQIETLQSGENLGNIEDVIYFRNKLYEALSVPLSRFKSESGLFSNRSEIGRDELEFSEFITRLRIQFSNLFFDLLRTQLLLKKVISFDEWEKVKDNIFFEFNRNNYFSELKNIEMLERRLDAFEKAKSIIGVTRSMKWAQTDVLQMTQEEIDNEERMIEEEKDKYRKRQSDFADEDGSIEKPGSSRSYGDTTL